MADIVFGLMRGRRAPGYDEARTWESPGTCAQVTHIDRTGNESFQSSAVFIISPVGHEEAHEG